MNQKIYYLSCENKTLQNVPFRFLQYIFSLGFFASRFSSAAFLVLTRDSQGKHANSFCRNSQRWEITTSPTGLFLSKNGLPYNSHAYTFSPRTMHTVLLAHLSYCDRSMPIMHRAICFKSKLLPYPRPNDSKLGRKHRVTCRSKQQIISYRKF